MRWPTGSKLSGSDVQRSAGNMMQASCCMSGSRRAFTSVLLTFSIFLVNHIAFIVVCRSTSPSKHYIASHASVNLGPLVGASIDDRAHMLTLCLREQTHVSRMMDEG